MVIFTKMWEPFNIGEQTHPWVGGTIRNITSQNFETHPTWKQYRTHLKKKIQFKFCIKRLPKAFRIWNFNWIFEN